VDQTSPATSLPALAVKLAHILGLPVGEILAVAAAGAPMIAPLLGDRLETRAATLLAVFLQSADDLESATTILSEFLRKDHRVDTAIVCIISKYDGGWFIPVIVSRDENGLARKVHDLLAPTARIAVPAKATAARAGKSGATGELILDERIMRMARLAIASSSAVILVGPPGTGKTSFIRQLLQEIAYNPAALGLAAPPKEPKWVTPTESWTAQDLLGGMGIDHAGRKRFCLGHLLEAIRQDRWLVLDEANRANMDRIFGPMLTWLADQRVELGPATSDVNSPPVVLDWNDKPQCETVRLDLLESDRIMVTDPIKFLAGSDWRLLGTYNAQDAHRVFGFGSALSRRFSHVPMPPIRPSQFQRALASRVRDLPPTVGRLILGLYSAHLHTPKAMLGPAVFLKVADYVRAGVFLPRSPGQHSEQPDSTGPSDPSEPPDSLDVDSEQTLDQLVAEGYLTSAGTWLGQLAPADIDALGQATVQAGMGQKHWDWIRSLLPTLS
jgi:hypothetical protein